MKTKVDEEETRIEDVAVASKTEDTKASDEHGGGMSGIVKSGETSNGVQTHAKEGSDDSEEEEEEEEQDVKVCDICGDAGREDLLAICCKCTDGAEHTYCMREMLDKVPEGDWLCEECKSEQDLKIQQQNKPDRGKRRNDNSEISSAPKRQALESIPGSPKTLSRESSFKNSDKGKVKVHPLSTGALLTNDSSGNFSKSNSFNSAIGNRKVKLVDEIIPSKRKLIRETVSSNSKEGPNRSMGKSTSFKSTSSSPRFSHDRDTKEKRHTKELSFFERKNSPRSESMAGSTISSSKFDKKSTPQGDSFLSSSMNNNRDYKAVNSDGKPVTISKSSGDSITKGVCKSEEKPNHTYPKEDSSSGSCVNERPLVASQVLQDGPSQTKDYFDENITASGKTVCQKYKGSGHLAQFCKVDRPVTDAPVVKNPREATNSTSDLKAAIEAAMLRKPGICRKSRVSDQSGNNTAANMNNETCSQDQSNSSNSKRNLNCAAKVHERPAISHNSTICYSNNAKQLGVLPVAMSMLLKTAIPEHQYIWQGGFEVHKSGKTLDLCEGIQAHLSTCASPKVLDAVKKFPCKVLLNEVSRSSAWPMQFQEFGVREHNIAVFFFPKDLGSYERSYKVLLRNLMKHDLALQGNFGGIELLIFPSNQLPESFQRWNTMFFLWGVFKGKKASSQHVSNTEKPYTTDIPRAVVPPPENVCSVEPTEKSVCSTPASDTEIPASRLSESASSHKAVEGTTTDVEFTSVQASERSSSPNKCDQISVPWATSADRHTTSHNADEAPAIASVVSSSKEPSDKNESTDERPLLTDNMDEDNTMNNKKRSRSPSSGSDQAIPSFGHSDNLAEEVHRDKIWKPSSDESHSHSNVEKFFFPVDEQQSIGNRPNSISVDSSIPWKVQNPLQESQDHHHKAPNLDLALGAETKPDILPFLAGKTVKKTTEDSTSDNSATKAEDDASASLSLSLSFPFPDQTQSSTVSKTEPAPLFLFGGLGKKADQ